MKIIGGGDFILIVFKLGSLNNSKNTLQLSIFYCLTPSRSLFKYVMILK